MDFIANFLDEIKFLSDYDYLFFLLIVVTLFLSLYISVKSNKETHARFREEEKRDGALLLRIEEMDSDLRDRLTRITRSSASQTETLRKNINTELVKFTEKLNGIEEKIGNGDNNDDAVIKAVQNASAHNETTGNKINTLFEQQGVFLHDRFSELAEKFQQIDAMAAALQQQGGSSDDDLNRISNSIMGQLSALMLQERTQLQEVQTQTTTLINDSVNRLAGEMDAKLTLIADKVNNKFNDNLSSAMQSFQTLQQQIDALIAAGNDIDALGQDVSSLTRLLLNKSGGGITGAHLPDMLAAMLPDDAYILNPMINGCPAAAQLMLPGDQGAVIIDSNLQLDKFEQVLAPDTSEEQRKEARQHFGEAVIRHINHVADKFISPPLTGNNALLFVSSETAFAEIQAHHKDCINVAAERQVWLVSPTTLSAALNMARSALKDQRARIQLEQMRHALQQVITEAQSFEARLFEIGDHVNNAMRSVQRAESASVRLFSDVRSVASIAGSDNTQPAEALPNSSDTSEQS